MITNNEIKQVRQLHQKKYRLHQRRFVVEGEKLVGELMASDVRVHALYVTAKREGVEYKSPMLLVSDVQMQKMSGLKTPPGILAVAEMPDVKPIENIAGWVLALEDIKDPGNFGTLLRIADWFGISRIVASKDCVDAFNPKCVQASMGAIFRIPVEVVDLPQWLKKQSDRGSAIFGADMQGEILETVSFPEAGIVVLGSESHGLSMEVQEALTKTISVPGKGKAESLNVAVAAGIICSRLPL